MRSEHATAEQIELPILEAPNGVEVSIEYFSVEGAERYLARMHPEKKRHVVQATVDAYARDMVAGQWTLAPQPMAYDVNGLGINGAHRSHAIVKSNRGQTFVVWRNCPPGIEAYFDSRRGVRNPVDSANIAFGLDISREEKSVLGAVVSMTGKVDWTPTELMAQWKKHGEIVRWIVGLAHPRSRATRAPILAAFAKASQHHGREKLEPLFRSFLTGTGCPKLLMGLRDRLMQTDTPALNSNANRELYQKAARAIQAEMRGEEITKLQGRKVKRSDNGKLIPDTWDPFPLIAPRPVA